MARRRQYKGLVIVPPVQGGNSWTIIASVNLDQWHQPIAQPLHKIATRPLGAITIDVLLALTTISNQPVFSQSGQSIAVNKLFQYQSRFEPLRALVVLENVTLDKWGQPMVVPTRRGKPRQVGIYVIDPTGLMRPEAVSIDRWHQETQRPRFDKKRTQFQYGFFVSDPLLLPDEEVETLDKWFVPTQIPVRRKDSRHIHKTTFNVDRVPNELGRFESWFQNTQTPSKKKSNTAYLTGSLSFVPVQPATPEDITLDKWYVPTVQRVNKKKQNPAGSTTDVFQTGAATVYVGIFTQSSVGVPVNKTFQYQANFVPLFAISSAEIVSLDKWFQPTQVPKRKKGTQYTNQSVFRSPNPIGTPSQIVSAAVNQTNVPFFKKKDYRRVYQSMFFGVLPIPNIEVVSMDKWFTPTQTPAKARKSQPHLSPFVFRDAKVIVPAEWIQPTGMPRFDKERTQYLYQWSAIDLRILELITMDKWFGSNNQPLFARPNNGHLYPVWSADKYLLLQYIGIILGRDNDTGVGVGKRTLGNLGLDKDTGIGIGRRSVLQMGRDNDTGVGIGKKLP